MSLAKQNSVSLELDEAGLLIDPSQWNENVAQSLAKGLGIAKLTPDHWLIIQELRRYYKAFGVAPAVHQICHQYKKDKNWVRDLFGMCLNAWCIAGLPDPGEEAKTYIN